MTAILALGRLLAVDLDLNIVVVLVVGAVDDPFGAAEVPARGGVGRVPFGDVRGASRMRDIGESVVAVGVAVMGDSNRSEPRLRSLVARSLHGCVSALVR